MTQKEDPARAALAHPMQPIIMVGNVVRFKENAMVRRLLDVAGKHGCSLNDLAGMGFSAEDHMQLAQLIGYSVSGYGDLSFASAESVATADMIANEVALGIQPTAPSTPAPQGEDRSCQYNGGTCTRRGCIIGCQASALLQGRADERAAGDAGGASDAQDASRLAWMYSGKKTGSMALVHLEMRLLNDEAVTLDEARAAIDESMRTPLIAAITKDQA